MYRHSYFDGEDFEVGKGLFFHYMWFFPSMGIAVQRLLEQPNGGLGDQAGQSNGATQHHTGNLLSPGSFSKRTTAAFADSVCLKS